MDTPEKATRREQAREMLEAASVIRARVLGSLIQHGRYGKGNTFLEFTPGQLALMHALRSRDGATIKELARMLYVSPSSVSAMVDRLVEMGAVSREQSKRDRREVIVRSTPAGEQAMDAIEDRMYNTIADLLEKLGPEYAQKWHDVFQRLRTILEEENVKPDKGIAR